MTTEPDRGNSHSIFPSTHWSVVVAAGATPSPDASAALAKLCEKYWYPLYCCVRRHGRSPEDAQDLTQAFFAKLLGKNQIALADRERGKFRTFLLRSLENFVRNEYGRASASKRGGGRAIISWDAQSAEDRHAAELSADLSPEEVFEKSWVSTLLTGVLAQLRREFAVSGRVDLFDRLEPYLWGDDTNTSYAQIAAGVEMTVVAVKVTMHRLRQRYRQLLRDEIIQTVDGPEAVDAELDYFRKVLAN